MTAITVRIRDNADRETIERLKAATNERTTAKALMRAARLYPDAREELRRRMDQLASARDELEKLRTAISDWQRARDLEHEARAKLDLVTPRPE